MVETIQQMFPRPHNKNTVYIRETQKFLNYKIQRNNYLKNLSVFLSPPNSNKSISGATGHNC